MSGNWRDTLLLLLIQASAHASDVRHRHSLLRLSELVIRDYQQLDYDATLKRYKDLQKKYKHPSYELGVPQ